MITITRTFDTEAEARAWLLPPEFSDERIDAAVKAWMAFPTYRSEQEMPYELVKRNGMRAALRAAGARP